MTPEEGDNPAADPTDDIYRIKDNGGTREGADRRQSTAAFEGSERRSGRDRRRGFDRRSGIDRRRASERRSRRFFWDHGMIERRDAYRRFSREE